MARQYPYNPISPWWNEPSDIQPGLQKNEQADVVIIGGGYTGLSTAISLRNKGVDVVVLDQGICGSGSSGRNAGHLAPTIGKDMPSLLKVFGRERARSLLNFAETAVRHTENVIKENQIDCRYNPLGNIMATVHKSQERALRKSAEIAADLGGDVEFLEEKDMRARSIPEGFNSGTLERTGGVLHPGELVLGLRKHALDTGVRLYENCKVSQLNDGLKVKAVCDGAEVIADKAVIATNAYTPSLKRLKRKAAPVIVTLLETERLTDQQRLSLGWPNREGIYTAHEILESYHLTAQQTIVAGSKQIMVPYGSRLKTTRQPSLFRKTTAAFRDRFPQLGELKIRTYWGGYIAISLDFIPVLGVTGKHENIHYGLGYAGHGVPQAIYMGDILSHRIQEIAHPGSEVLNRKTYSWPPEPLRWTGGQLIKGILTLMDKHVDRKVRNTGWGSQKRS